MYRIEGHPVTLKNSNQIVVFKDKTGKMKRRVIRSKQADAYRKNAKMQLKMQRGKKQTIKQPVMLIVKIYGAWKKTSGNLPDLSNLLQMAEEVLEDAGIIENDRLIDGYDGSRRICLCDNCDERPIYKAGPNKGKRKPDCGAVKQCPHERVTIQIGLIVSYEQYVNNQAKQLKTKEKLPVILDEISKFTPEQFEQLRLKCASLSQQPCRTLNEIISDTNKGGKNG